MKIRRNLWLMLWLLAVLYYIQEGVAMAKPKVSLTNISLMVEPTFQNTKIEYQLKQPDFVKMSVQDALGYEIYALVNEQQNVGTHEYWINPKQMGYPSGTYYVVYQTPTQKEKHAFVIA